jgi:apolipoprotein D and lipocalin family protein
MFRPRIALIASTLALVGAGAAAAAAPASAEGRPPVKPVASLDLSRYLGQWRQIAAIPQWFELLCTNDTVANYGLNPDGTVRVVNRCYGPLKTPIVTRGVARVLDKTTNAQLQVSFAFVGGQWLFPGTTPNYVVLGLADDYSWAVVGDPNRTSAFVLSRSATLTPDALTAVKAALVATGYNPCKLNTDKQNGGLQVVKPLCQV